MFITVWLLMNRPKRTVLLLSKENCRRWWYSHSSFALADHFIMQIGFFQNLNVKLLCVLYITCDSFKLLSNYLFKILPQSFYIVQSQKYGVRHVHRFVRIQPGTLGEKLSGGEKIMRRQNN